MKKILFISACCLLMANVANARSSYDDMKIRALCDSTTGTILASGNVRVNPESSERCYKKTMEDLRPEVVVDKGEVYLKYKAYKKTRSTVYKSTVEMVNGVYTNVTTVEEQPTDYRLEKVR